MPKEIKTTIAVDGEAAFKRAINEANTSQVQAGRRRHEADGDPEQDAQG